MKRSDVLDIIDGILIDHQLPILQGISKEILSKLESIGFSLVETYEDDEKNTYPVPYEPEEGWDVYFAEQDKKDNARDFKVHVEENESWSKSKHIALEFLQGKSFEELAKEYNVTRERIRQIVAKQRRRYQRHIEGKNDE